MSPTAMLTLMFAAIAMFTWSASRRWKLLQIGQPATRLDHIGVRLRGTWRYAFRQEKMDYYNPAGMGSQAHFHGLCAPQHPRSDPDGAGLLRPLRTGIFGPGQAVGEGLRAREGRPWNRGAPRNERLFLLPPGAQAEANGPHLRGPAHHRDHRHVDALRTWRTTEPRQVLAAADKTGLCDGWLHLESADDRCKAIATIKQRRSRESSGTAPGRPWPGPASSFFAMLLQGYRLEGWSGSHAWQLLASRRTPSSSS